MFERITSLYGALIRGLLVLATAGAITAVSVEKSAKNGGTSVRTGLVRLKALNAKLGM